MQQVAEQSRLVRHDQGERQRELDMLMNIVDIRGQGAGTRQSRLDMLMNSIKKARVAMGEEPAHFLNMMDGNFITLQVGVVIISIIASIIIRIINQD